MLLAQRMSEQRNLLQSHLGNGIERAEALTGKVLLVLAHLYSVQPLIHAVEAGEVWSAAVQ